MSKKVIRAEYENNDLLQNAVDYLCKNGIDHNNIKVETQGSRLSENMYKDSNSVFLGSASSLTSEATVFSPESAMRLFPIVNAVETMGKESMHPRSFESDHANDDIDRTIYIRTKKDEIDNIYGLLEDTGASRITSLH